VPAAGDGVVEDNIGGVLHSQLTVILDDMLPGEVREISRNYTVHCFSKSMHDNAIRFEVGVAPVYPVAEEDVGGAKPNVRKQNIDITAYAVADVKKLGLIVPDPPMTVGVPLNVVVRSVSTTTVRSARSRSPTRSRRRSHLTAQACSRRQGRTRRY
jgi:hypothetical protein